ncbi:MAG: hypothetical protein AAGG80_05530, partial [Pseudomonadota bacterium]
KQFGYHEYAVKNDKNQTGIVTVTYNSENQSDGAMRAIEIIDKLAYKCEYTGLRLGESANGTVQCIDKKIEPKYNWVAHIQK